MEWLKDKQNQQKVAVSVGYFLVFALAFGLGRLTTFAGPKPDVRVVPFATEQQSNFTSSVEGIQTENVAGEQNGNSLVPVDGECGGKIKGNIGSSGKIYHVPGGSFYTRTDAEKCFVTEADAVAAGFRKSSR
jgi:hypothetical protein